MISYILIGLVFVSLSKSHHFREDYEYNRETNAFYKLHIKTRYNFLARSECSDEGANLMLLTSDLDIAQVQYMLKKYPDIGEYVWVAKDNMLHEPVETIPDLRFNQTLIEQTLLGCNVVTRSGEVRLDDCENERPFICKVEEKETAFYKLCNPSTRRNWTQCDAPRITKVYRSDYEYNGMTDAFYKLHKESVGYEYAKIVCELEGAQLMLPKTDFDVDQLHAMYEKYPELLEKHVWINHDRETRSAEENPIKRIDNSEDNRHEEMRNYCDIPVSSLHSPMDCESISRQGEIRSTECYSQRPFICKVNAEDAPYDSTCDVYGKNYRYIKSVGSCYTIPITQYTWNEAYAECQAQRAHLVVLNSPAERSAVLDIMLMSKVKERYDDLSVRCALSRFYFNAGFRARKPSRTFMTIFNQTLEEAGYSEWSFGEPSNYGGNEYCGSLHKMDGRLNDHNCAHAYGFICEKEIRHLDSVTL